MRFVDLLVMSMNNLRRRKLRTALTEEKKEGTPYVRPQIVP